MSASLEASLRLDIAQFQAQLAKSRAEAKKFKDQLQSGGGFGKSFSGASSAIAGIAGAAGLGMLVRRGMEFNQIIGDSEIAISQVLRQFKGLSTEAAKQEAAKAMQAMVDLEPESAATLTGLVDGFLATLGSSQAVGIDVAQNIELVGKFANALANAKIPAEQLSQEMRSILTGNIGADSTLAKTLNISNADIEKAREAGKLYEFLVNKIGILGEAGDTAGVAFSTLNSALDKAAGALTKGLFEESVNGAKSLAVVLGENADTFEMMGQGAATLVSWLVKAAEVGKGIGQTLGGIAFAMNGDGKDTVDPKLMANLRKRGMNAEANSIQDGMVGDRGTFAYKGMAMDQVEREANRNAGAASRGAATGAAVTGSGAPDKKALLEAQKEINRLQEQEAALADKRFQDYLSILPPNLQLIEIKREMLRLEQDKAALIGPGLDEERIKLETDLLNLGKARRDAERDLVAEKDRAAEKDKEANEKAGQQAYALALFEQEMEIINAKIAGNKELTAELQRHAAIQELMNQLLESTNLSEQEAVEKATQMVDLKKDLESQTSKKDDKIKGYSRERQGGADEARQRAEDRVNAARDKRDQAVEDAFGGLTPKDQAQQNPLAAQAQRNAAAQDPARGGAENSTQIAQQILGVIQQMLPLMQ